MELLSAILLGILLTPRDTHMNTLTPPPARAERVIATYYADPSRRRDRFHGRPTASGERMNGRALTAAHGRLPFGTMVRVTNLTTGKSVDVRINDRGPYTEADIDLSWGAAERIGMIHDGKVHVSMRVLHPKVKRTKGNAHKGLVRTQVKTGRTR